MVSLNRHDDSASEVESPEKTQTSAPTQQTPAVDLEVEARRRAASEVDYYRHQEPGIKAPLMPEKKEDDSYDAIKDFWTVPAQCLRYQVLWLVAVSHLIVQATAARPERTFSWCGLLAAAKRGNMKPQHF